MPAPEERPKYSLLEIERRWLVDLARVGSLAGLPFRRLEDAYWPGTRLRLRQVIDPEGRTTYKFGIKYGESARGVQPVTNLYLDKAEYEALAAAGGLRVSKRRYLIAGGCLDVFDIPAGTPAYFEVEFGSEQEAQAYEPPPFVTEEIT